MGRLFWKFFFFIWLAQLTTFLGVTGYFWWERQQAERHWQSTRPAADEHRPPPPGEGRDFRPGPGPQGGHPYPPRRMHLPVEPLVGGFLASLIFAALLARYFSRPIRTLRSAFDATAAGRLDVRIGSAMGQRRDELTDLGRDFDRMADRLQALVEGQRRLLHDVSHELRSPLARLQAAVGLARQQPARMESSMGRIEKESVRIDQLVGELLTLTRLEAGTDGRGNEAIDLAELLAGIVADASFEAQAQGVQVELSGSAEVVVEGEPELLHRAIENVVRNALKYSPAGAAVGVASGIDAAARQVWIRVDDAGPGVPEEDRELIFQPFYRGSHGRDSDGHGLGLAIARRVVQSMGGRIAAANRPGGGFRVEIVLPLDAPPPPR